MRGMTIAAVLAGIAGIASAGFTVTYDGEGSPADDGFDYIVFGGTTWNTDDGALNMTTAPVRGIWMGAFQSSPILPPDNVDGSYLKLDVKMGVGAVEWSTYINDGSHGASFAFDHDGFSYNTAGQSVRVDTDLTDAFSTFEILLKDGRVSYVFNGQVLANRALATETTNAKIMLIGDGSGSTPTGAGSMSVDNVTWLGGPDFDAIPTPGVAGVLAMAGLASGRRRR
ncbi:MAG: hypothetical protein AAF297_07305 [Planctomycetota bacterium]